MNPQELQPRDEQMPAPQSDSDAAQLMGAITRVASDPNANVDAMRQMMELYKEARAMEARSAYSAAMARFVAMKETIAHNRTGQGPGGSSFTYADYPTMETAVRPWLSKCGLSFSHHEGEPVIEGGRIVYVTVTCRLQHEAGHSEEFSYPAMPNPKVADKLSPSQAIQQGITYAKRQTLAMALGLATAEDRDDDDSQRIATVSEEQVSTLLDLISAWEPSPEEREMLLKWCRVSDIEDIPARNFSAVERKLKEKIAQKEGR